jgi:hypothetical protein
LIPEFPPLVSEPEEPIPEFFGQRRKGLSLKPVFADLSADAASRPGQALLGVVSRFVSVRLTC